MQYDAYIKDCRGQMKVEERRALYQVLMQYQPKRLLEVGTRYGGGSTFILASAAARYGGELDTIEADADCHAKAVQLYEEEIPTLRGVISFHLGRSETVIPVLPHPDFVLLDGAEDAEQTILEYYLLYPALNVPGALLACHDWNILKMSKLRPLIKSDIHWDCIVDMPETTTGFMIFKRRDRNDG